jgi:dTMP kinase
VSPIDGKYSKREESHSGLVRKSSGSLFIVFEGIDGSGKSTQTRMLADALTKKGIPVLLTSEPSDGPVGTSIRSLKERLTPEEELKLFNEDRRYHVKQVIEPALDTGKTVICDRYYYSTAAYQGAQGIDPHKIIDENLEIFPKPDIAFLLTIPVDEAIARISERNSQELAVFEKRNTLQAVDRVYSSLECHELIRIDGSQTEQFVHEYIISIINNLI